MKPNQFQKTALTAFAAGLVLGLTPVANAATLTYNSDDLVEYNGLEWLKPEVTSYLSAYDILNSGILDGFRYATEDEIFSTFKGDGLWMGNVLGKIDSGIYSYSGGIYQSGLAGYGLYYEQFSKYGLKEKEKNVHGSYKQSIYGHFLVKDIVYCWGLFQR